MLPDAILAYLREHPYTTAQAISKAMEINFKTVSGRLRRLRTNGHVDYRARGKCYEWFLVGYRNEVKTWLTHPWVAWIDRR